MHECRLKLDYMLMKGEFVELGEIKGVHGVRGEVKVNLTTDSPKQRFGKSGTKLYLKAPVQKGGLLARKEESSPLIEVSKNHFPPCPGFLCENL